MSQEAQNILSPTALKSLASNRDESPYAASTSPQALYILSLNDFVVCQKTCTNAVAVQACSLNHLLACCAILLLSRGGQNTFHGGSLDVRGLVIAPELFVQSYCLGLLAASKQLLGTDQAGVGC